MLSATFLTCSSRVPLLQTVLQCDPITVLVRTPEQGSWDPSTLLSTLSQASAVLVAIIGGFLVSRLVAISSEREGIRRLLAAASGRVSHVESDLNDARRLRLGRAQRNFFERAVGKFLEDASLDLDKLLHDLVPRGTTEEELKPYALKLSQRTAKAVTQINEKVKKSDTNRLKLEDLTARGLVIEDADRELYDIAFKHRRDRLPSPSTLSMLHGGSLYDMSSLTAAVTPSWIHEREARRTDEELRAEADLRTQLKAAKAERDRLNEELVRVGKPAGVVSAIWMLGILSLGILVPVVVMALEPKTMPAEAKFWLITSFIMGLIAILGYVVWFWKKIGTDEDQTTTPE